jgi:uncharacterized protein
MKENELREYFKSGRILVARETYVIVKSRRACARAFAVIRDRNETSSIVEEGKLGNQKFLGIEGGWRLITFDMILPFGLIGFLAHVSGALAREGIPILALSAYSTDHMFVKSKDLDRAVKALAKLGFSVRRL